MAKASVNSDDRVGTVVDERAQRAEEMALLRAPLRAAQRSREAKVVALAAEVGNFHEDVGVAQTAVFWIACSKPMCANTLGA